MISAITSLIVFLYLYIQFIVLFVVTTNRSDISIKKLLFFDVVMILLLQKIFLSVTST